jgi:hypothetical protein
VKWLFATIAALLLKVVLDELLEWCPWVAERLIRRAANGLSSESQERYREEWLGELQGLDGKGLSKLVFAIHILWSAQGVREALGEIRLPRRTTILLRLLDICGSALILFTVAPLFALIAAAIRIHDRGPAFVREFEVRDDEIVNSRLVFRTFQMSEAWDVTSCRSVNVESTIGRWLRRSALHPLPGLVDVFRGRMSLVGPPASRQSGIESVKPGFLDWRFAFERRDEMKWSVGPAAEAEWAAKWKPRHALRALARSIRYAFHR